MRRLALGVPGDESAAWLALLQLRFNNEVPIEVRHGLRSQEAHDRALDSIVASLSGPPPKGWLGLVPLSLRAFPSQRCQAAMLGTCLRHRSLVLRIKPFGLDPHGLRSPALTPLFGRLLLE
jgi:hypothetical protein